MKFSNAYGRGIAAFLAGCSALLMATSAGASSVTVGPDQPSGIIRSTVTQVSKDIYRVRFAEIDGVIQLSPQPAYWLAPGKHSIKLVPQIEQPALRLSVQGKRSEAPHPPLVITIEKDHSYTIGAKLTGKFTWQWKPIIIRDRLNK